MPLSKTQWHQGQVISTLRLRVALALPPTCFTPFCFNAPCYYTLLLNLRPLVFGLKSYGWLRCITLIPAYSTVSYRNRIYDLRLFIYTLFQEHSYRVKQGLLCVCTLLKVKLSLRTS